MIGVQEIDRCGLLRVEARQLKPAVAGVDEVVALPHEVDRIELLTGQNHSVSDQLTGRAGHGAAQCSARPQGRRQAVYFVSGLDLVGDDLVGVEALPPR